MFPLSFLRVSVLVTALYLSSHMVSSKPAQSMRFFTTRCTSEFTGGAGDDIIVCQQESLEQQNCYKSSCWLNGNQWVQLDGCLLLGTDSGVSKQHCVSYNWLATQGVFSCHNHGGRDYYCKGTPKTIPYITCTQCFVN